jgi:hypothetical protein
MATGAEPYVARLEIDFPDQLDRLTTLLRLLWIIPISVLYSLLTATGTDTIVTATGQRISQSSGGILGGLFVATTLMILFRQRYPRWWFDFARELTRFGARIGAYLALLTDRYPSTIEEQVVHLEIEYPDVERDLNRWLPLVKWLVTALHRAPGALARRVRGGGDRLVRDSDHGALSAGPIRFRGRSWPVEPASRCVRVLVAHRPLPTVQSPLNRSGIDGYVVHDRGLPNRLRALA